MALLELAAPAARADSSRPAGCAAGAASAVGATRAASAEPTPRTSPTPEARLAELAACAGALRRVLAAVAARLVATRAWQRLCYARLSDYARERPGLSARQLQELSRVHQALARLPELERALVRNALPWSKVRLVARVAAEDDVRAWIARARAQPVRRLEQEVRAHPRASPADGPDDDDVEPTARLTLRCTPALREKWHFVRELAERVAGQRLRAEDALEQVLAEVASALACGGDGSADAGASGLRAAAGSPHAPASPGRAAARACADDAALRAPRAPARALPPEVAALAHGLDSADAFELDRRLRRAVQLEQSLDAAIAPLLRQVGCAEYEWDHAYTPLPAYAREQVGISASKARTLLRLERAGELCPELLAAWRSGRLSWVKARLLAPLLLLDLPGAWRPVWVEWAARVTVRRLERDVERALLLRAGHARAFARCESDPARAQDPIPEGERQLCAHDVDVDATEELTFRLPRDVLVLFCAVRAALRRQARLRGVPLRPGDIFEAMLDHAAATWLLRDPAAPRPDPVIERDGYLCAVPGCTSRRNLHDHHVRFRSAGGSHAHENRITLCAFHHHRCLHAGLLRVYGRAPDALVFELGLRFDGSPPLARYRSGDLLIEPPSAHAPPAGAPRAA